MGESESADPRRLLLDAFRAGLEAARGDRLTARALEGLRFERSVALVAAGKAAGSMARGAAEALGARIVWALVVDPEETRGSWPFPCRVVRAEHPVPGGGSLAAGKALVELLDEIPRETSCLFLISGGASSLVEVPVPGVTLDDLRQANEWLLASGLDIGRINAVRRRLSCIKGGGLARYLGDRDALVLALSDVPEADPAVIGSGWLALPCADPVPGGLPDWLAALTGRAPPPLSGDDPIWQRIDIRVIGDNAIAREAAAARLCDAGLAVSVPDERLAGDAARQGRRLAKALAAGEAGGVVRGGECTVTLPASPGRGGRCQHLALAAAEVLAGRDDCFLLAAGTDGRDGNAEAAGALVDGGTVQRGEAEGHSVREALERADSGAFLDASGDLVDTGATGTNVNDLVIGVRV